MQEGVRLSLTSTQKLYSDDSKGICTIVFGATSARASENNISTGGYFKTDSANVIFTGSSLK